MHPHDVLVLLIAIAWIANGTYRIIRPGTWWQAPSALTHGDAWAWHVRRLVAQGRRPPTTRQTRLWSLFQIVFAVAFAGIWLAT